MTAYDQREELHAALGHKMMGTSSIGRAADSNSAAALQPCAGSLPASPATSHTVALIRMGEDGKITYGGDRARIHELVSKLAENSRPAAALIYAARRKD